MNQPDALIWEQHIPGGCHWSGIVRRGTTLRLADVSWWRQCCRPVL